MKKVNQFLGEKSGQTLRAEIYQYDGGHEVHYYINESLQKKEQFTENNIHFVEDAAENWINGIKVLNG